MLIDQLATIRVLSRALLLDLIKSKSNALLKSTREESEALRGDLGPIHGGQICI